MSSAGRDYRNADSDRRTETRCLAICRAAAIYIVSLFPVNIRLNKCALFLLIVQIGEISSSTVSDIICLQKPPYNIE